jgi:hypothetical protein
MSNRILGIGLDDKLTDKVSQLNPMGYIENLHADISRFLPQIEPQWIYGLVNIEEAASFQFVVLEDL